MTDITAKLDAIEAGLKGVTPGPWNVEPRNRSKNFSVAFRPELKVCQTFGDSVAAEADAAHIARLDPNTVRELVRLARIGADAPAIRAAALEEAAKVAEQKFRIDQIRRDRMLDEEWEQDRETAGDEIAAAIRALIPAPPKAK